MDRGNSRKGDYPKENRPFIIPIFIPHRGCPHRCVFCNQSALTRAHPQALSAQEIRRQVRRFLDYRGPRRGTTQIAFFGGNFLGLTADDITAFLTEAGRFVADGEVDGIRFSTRPETVTSVRLEQIASFPVATIELGVQSMDDRVLRLARRGHTAADTESAVARLRERNYEIGCQMMVGLPGDDDAGAMASGGRIAALSPDFVRIYPTVVLSGTELAGWYQASRYRPMALDACIDLVKKLYLLFSDLGIRVVRMGLQATAELDSGSAVIAGPYHPAFGHMVLSRIFFDRAVSAIEAMVSSAGSPSASLCLRISPRDESRLRGLKSGNLHALRNAFPDLAIRVLADASVPQGTLNAVSSKRSLIPKDGTGVHRP